MSGTSKHELLGAWMRGEPTSKLTAAQLRDLAGEVIKQNAAAYSDPKHRDHEFVSEQVRGLFTEADAKTTPGEQQV